MITIAIDVMSGDYGLPTTVYAAADIIHKHKDVSLALVGDTGRISQILIELELSDNKRIYAVAASEVVTMEDTPAFALRKKKDSSMRVAINLVHSAEADACVSAGNTGALMATARFVLKTIPGIERPAICASLPRLNGHFYMLDLGANIECPPSFLYQFGLMGSVLIECLEGKSRPSVGLLNIGIEDIKGNKTIKAAAKLFQASNLNYDGYIEGDRVFTGDTELIVCDGFDGNVALKTAEGVAQMVMGVMREEFSTNLITKSSAYLARPVLKRLKHRLDHRRYNGGSFLGLRGTVVKSHGSADQFSFVNAIEAAIIQVRERLVARIEDSLIANGI